MLRNTRDQWGSIAKGLHWLIALLIFGMFVLGWTAASYPISPTKIKLFTWHKSIGLVILSLVVLRLWWRWFNPVPDLPVHMSRWERTLARANHWSLYAIMIAMPISGWVINSAANFPLKLFGWLLVPNIAPPDKALQTTAENIHLALFWILVATLLLHVAAALHHHFAKHDPVLRRMLPFAKPY